MSASEIRSAFRNKPAGPATPPRYPSRVVPIDDAVKAEFDVVDAHGLVEILNAMRARNGERPIPQGDFPGNRRGLAFVLADLRRLRALAAGTARA